MTADERLFMIRLKVERAKHHIEDLQLCVRGFLDSKPYEVRTKDDPETGKRIYYISRVDPVPLTVAAIAGDILQNLRSALDHTAYQIASVGAGGAPPKPWEIQYPIADDATKYRDLRNRTVQGARQDGLDAIDATKPYKGGNDTIWRIHRLNNIDKHRLLLTIGSAFRSLNLSPLIQSSVRKGAPEWVKNIPIPPVYIKPADRLFPLKVGDELFIDAIGHEIHEKMDFRFDVAFGEPGIVEGEPLLETLQQMTELVDGIVSGFKPVLA